MAMVASEVLNQIHMPQDTRVPHCSPLSHVASTLVQSLSRSDIEKFGTGRITSGREPLKIAYSSDQGNGTWTHYIFHAIIYFLLGVLRSPFVARYT
jgi:hypothetical protein